MGIDEAEPSAVGYVFGREPLDERRLPDPGAAEDPDVAAAVSRLDAKDAALATEIRGGKPRDSPRSVRATS
jgi:hypothetical protein